MSVGEDVRPEMQNRTDMMDAAQPPWALQAGELACNRLQALRFTVLAVFERSLYLECATPPDGAAALHWEPLLVCCGRHDLTPGPLNVLFHSWPPVNFLPRPGEHVRRVGESLLWPGGGFNLSALRCRPSPALPVPEKGCALSPQRGLDTLRRLLTHHKEYEIPLPKEGLAPLLIEQLDLPRPLSSENEMSAVLLGKGRDALQALAVWLRGSQIAPVPASAVATLVGLGPGLTPSGDDVLGGMLLGLHALARRPAADALAGAIGAVADTTNRISRAHLAAAARGTGAEPLMELTAAMLADTMRPDIMWQDTMLTDEQESTMAALVRQVSSIGHSSGWDALLGLCTAMKQERCKRPDNV